MGNSCSRAGAMGTKTTLLRCRLSTARHPKESQHVPGARGQPQRPAPVPHAVFGNPSAYGTTRLTALTGRSVRAVDGGRESDQVASRAYDVVLRDLRAEASCGRVRAVQCSLCASLQ